MGGREIHDQISCQGQVSRSLDRSSQLTNPRRWVQAQAEGTGADLGQIVKLVRTTVLADPILGLLSEIGERLSRCTLDIMLMRDLLFTMHAGFV